MQFGSEGTRKNPMGGRTNEKLDNIDKIKKILCKGK